MKINMSNQRKMKKRSYNHWRIASLIVTVIVTNELNFVKSLSLVPVMENLISIAIARMSMLIDKVMGRIITKKLRILKIRNNKHFSSKVL